MIDTQPVSRRSFFKIAGVAAGAGAVAVANPQEALAGLAKENFPSPESTRTQVARIRTGSWMDITYDQNDQPKVSYTDGDQNKPLQAKFGAMDNGKGEPVVWVDIDLKRMKDASTDKVTFGYWSGVGLNQSEIGIPYVTLSDIAKKAAKDGKSMNGDRLQVALVQDDSKLSGENVIRLSKGVTIIPNPPLGQGGVTIDGSKSVYAPQEMGYGKWNPSPMRQRPVTSLGYFDAVGR